MAGNNLLAAKILRDSNTTKGGTNALAEQFPELYGAIKGLLGTAPDEVGGSVLDGSHQAQKAGAGYGFPIGLLANILPSAAPAINKTASILGKAAEPTVNAFVARTMANGGKPAQLLQDMAQGTQSKIFIGPKAKTWDKAAAAKAQEMLDSGVNPRQVWTETGTWKAPDGLLRQEIDDSTAVFPKFKNYRRGPFEEMAMHEPLEDAYPDIKNIILEASPGGTLSGGEYRPLVNFHDVGPRESITIRNSDESLLGNKSIGLHELQHAIQQREGFARGGSPESASEVLDKYRQTKEQFDRALKQSLEASDPIAKSNAAQERQFYGLQLGKTPYLRDMTPHDAYLHLAGEAEARATQARLGMDAAQRRATFPEDSYDVPVNQLIVRNSGSGEQMSLPVNQFVYPQEQALLTAQRNAALPVEQGGLGLHPNNTPMDRAQAMGFDTEAFHGSPNPDIAAFDPSLAGKNTSNAFDNYLFSTSEPKAANGYSLSWDSFKNTIANDPAYQAAEKAKNELYAKIPDAFAAGDKEAVKNLRTQADELSKVHHDYYDRFLNQEIPSDGSSVYPLSLQSDHFYPSDAEGKLWREVNQSAIDNSKHWGYDGVRIGNVRDNAGNYGGLSDVYATSNPSRIRSRFAAFDPMRRDSPDILAGLLPLSMADEDNRNQLRGLLGY